MNPESHHGTIPRNSVKHCVKAATHENMEKSDLMKDGYCKPKTTSVGSMDNANVAAHH